MRHIELALLHSLWQGPLLALTAFLVSRLMSKPADRHKIFFGAVVLTALAPVATLLLFQLPRKLDKDQVMAMLKDGLPIQTASSSFIPEAYLSLAALAVAVLFGSWLFTKRTFGKQACEAPDWLEQAASEEARKLGMDAPVKLRVCGSGVSPATSGFRKPMIVLPSSLLGLPESELRSLLAHELAHIKRRDYFFALLQSTATAVAFYQPTVWLLNRWIRDERERACDDLVVEKAADPLDYALALARIEFGKAGRPLAILSASGGGVSSRIKRLSRARSHKAAPRGLLAGSLIVGALLCCTGFFFRPIGQVTFIASGKVRMYGTPKVILFEQGEKMPVAGEGKPAVHMMVVKELSPEDREKLAKMMPQ